VVVEVAITLVVVELVVASTFSTPYLFVRDKHFQSALVQEVLKAQQVETQFCMWVIQSLLQREAPEVEHGQACRVVVRAEATLPEEPEAAPEEPVDKVVLVQTTLESLHVMVAPV
jgi:hypothetical protein